MAVQANETNRELLNTVAPLLSCRYHPSRINVADDGVLIVTSDTYTKIPNAINRRLVNFEVFTVHGRMYAFICWILPLGINPMLVNSKHSSC
jgi:hypothetical protein